MILASAVLYQYSSKNQIFGRLLPDAADTWQCLEYDGLVMVAHRYNQPKGHGSATIFTVAWRGAVSQGCKGRKPPDEIRIS